MTSELPTVNSARYSSITTIASVGRVSCHGVMAPMLEERPETRDLLDQARQGEAEAVERLLTAHREPLRRMIGLRLDPALAARLDASDVVQDVLLEAHRRLSDYLRKPVMPFHKIGRAHV